MTTTVIATIFVFGLLVFVHELGHFITAKFVGMRVDEFAIGFGPSIWSEKRGETLYSLRIIPLGGYNKIAGMDPDEEQDEKSFNSKPILSRMLVIIAGSGMNFLLPIILFFTVFMAAGIDTASTQPIIGSIMPDRPAQRAGLLAGDKIIGVNGSAIDAWPQFVKSIQESPDKSLTIEFERDGKKSIVQVMPEYDAKANRGILGVVPQINNYQPSVFESIWLSIKQTYLISVAMITGIVQMVTGKIAAEVAGPIGVAQMAGQVAQLGIMPLLQFTAFLSINLGLINLLPVPVLDGGHVVTLAVEGIRGKPLNKDKMQIIQMIGFSLLILLMILATFKDITRLDLF